MLWFRYKRHLEVVLTSLNDSWLYKINHLYRHHSWLHALRNKIFSFLLHWFQNVNSTLSVLLILTPTKLSKHHRNISSVYVQFYLLCSLLWIWLLLFFCSFLLVFLTVPFSCFQNFIETSLKMNVIPMYVFAHWKEYDK